MKKKIRVGSRDSELALIQTNLVINTILKTNPDLEFEIVSMKTTGDKILNKTLDQIGGKGLFVKELDEALLSGAVDITVHSYKDLPMEENPALPIVALSPREDPRDVLIRSPFTDMPIGSASMRRCLQLQTLFPNQKTAPVRGNLQTRLRKLDEGGYCALVLAAAGVKRLGLQDRIDRYFSVEEILPAASQGILAVQGRRAVPGQREEDFSFLQGFHSLESEILSQAERAFVTALDGGCSSPIAAYAVIDNGLLTLKGLYSDGISTTRGQISGDPAKAAQLGQELAQKLKG